MAEEQIGRIYYSWIQSEAFQEAAVSWFYQLEKGKEQDVCRYFILFIPQPAEVWSSAL